MSDQGSFPFGQPNRERSLRPASSGTAAALVVGVYPSAFHVAWSPPTNRGIRLSAKRTSLAVSSLAVDVEPTVFWDGITPDPAQLLVEWKKAVGFKESWGTVRVGHNGPSGDGLITDYLTPLGLRQDTVAMTDVVPWFFVKDGDSSQRAAMEWVNEVSAQAELGIPSGTLPKRPTASELVAIVRTPSRRESLRRELTATGAPVIITLGQEALDGVRAVVDGAGDVQLKLAHDEQYGSEGWLTVDGHRLRWIALAHPGLIRQKKEDSPWRAAHAAWGDRMRSLRKG